MKLHHTEAEKCQRWNTEKAKGKNSFIWKFGFLRFGLPVSVLVTGVLRFFEPDPNLLINAVAFLFFWALLGYGHGAILWHWLEKSTATD